MSVGKAEIEKYMTFMGIDSFPSFEQESYQINTSNDYCYAARAEYDSNTKTHKLLLPENIEIPIYLLYHELTHILDMEVLAIGSLYYDNCLTGYMEYHASQVELLYMMGAKTVNSKNEK